MLKFDVLKIGHRNTKIPLKNKIPKNKVIIRVKLLNNLRAIFLFFKEDDFVFFELFLYI
jgi:hypothetical protein